MGKPSGTDRKVHALREQGTLNPHPKRIRDDEFLQEPFFDARDLVQVKYEMLRRVKVEGSSISQAARSFGFSRPAFYQARGVFDARGLPGLIPKRRGPKGGHKLNEGVMTFLEGLLNQDPALGTDELSQRLKEEYGIQVHPRTVERALKRRKKNGRPRKKSL
jgi:transposase